MIDLDAFCTEIYEKTVCHSDMRAFADGVKSIRVNGRLICYTLMSAGHWNVSGV